MEFSLFLVKLVFGTNVSCGVNTTIADYTPLNGKLKEGDIVLLWILVVSVIIIAQI